MCGIYGMVGRAGDTPDAAVVARMSGALVHRGPDGDGLVVRGRAALGCRRLAIIDVARGAQPLTDESGDVVVVCNGEIYNHHALRDELSRRGHHFRTGSDVEVIPHLYEERGVELVDALEGMFAIALWDARRGRLVLARDRLGEKPLYWARAADGLLFASEPKAILASGLVDRLADGEAIAGYLRTGYVAAPRSAFAQIAKLLPGTRLVVEDGAVRSETYWDVVPWLSVPPFTGGFEAAAREVRAALEQAVAAALVSDVPVGVFLSGGLDSTSMAAIARAQVGPELRTFTLGFEVPSFDERRHAAVAVKALGTRHQVVMITPDLFLEGLRELTAVLDEPLFDQSYVPTYLLARHARQFVKAVLVGEGSDELFAGYPTYVGGLFVPRYQRLPARWRRWLADVTPRLGAPHANTTVRYMLRRFLEMAEAPSAVRHRAWTGCMSPDDVAALAGTESALVPPAEPQALPARSELDALLGLDLVGYLRDDLLTNLDRATMAASLEGRAPFLNHHLVELACRLPAEFKLRGVIGKRVLRRAVADLVPTSTRRRVKRGLSVPLAAWLAGPLFPLARETLARLDPRVVKPSVVRTLLDEHVERRRDNRRELWALIVLQLWAERCAVTWAADTPRDERVFRVAAAASAAAPPS